MPHQRGPIFAIRDKGIGGSHQDLAKFCTGLQARLSPRRNNEAFISKRSLKIKIMLYDTISDHNIADGNTRRDPTGYTSKKNSVNTKGINKYRRR
jgi:hypothetical protein